MTNRRQQSKWLLALRIILFSLAIYYIGYIILNNVDQFKNYSVPNIRVFIISSFINLIVYFIISLFLAFSWLALNNFYRSKQLFLIYLKSIALKYLPGNVLHFFYRHAESRRVGQSHKKLIEATLLETIGQVLIAVMVASVLFFWPDAINKITQLVPNQLLIIGAITLIFILLITLIIRTKISQLMIIMTMYNLYYLGLGLICILSLRALGFESLPYWQITGIFAIAWLAGYVTPGAPGGIGVREAVFILLGTPILAEYQAITVIAYIRVLSILTESIIYFIAPKITNLFGRLFHAIDKTAL